MTIQEALQSGKAFKRPAMFDFIDPHMISLHQLSKDDLLAGDWVVQTKVITLSIDELAAIWDQVAGSPPLETKPIGGVDLPSDTITASSQSPVFQALAQALGLL